jgi:hypothetical protein
LSGSSILTHFYANGGWLGHYVFELLFGLRKEILGIQDLGRDSSSCERPTANPLRMGSVPRFLPIIVAIETSVKQNKLRYCLISMHQKAGFEELDRILSG